MNIVLIGYRGSGKSQVGRELARRLGWPFVDTDAHIEQRAGMTIRDIFEQRGEPVFRELESQTIAEVAAADGQVISAGGGAILREQNVRALKSSSKVVWLTAPPEVLWSRIEADAATQVTRPNLTAAGGLEEVRNVLNRRIPLYANAADITVDTQNRSVPQIIDAILSALAIPS